MTDDLASRMAARLAAREVAAKVKSDEEKEAEFQKRELATRFDTEVLPHFDKAIKIMNTALIGRATLKPFRRQGVHPPTIDVKIETKDKLPDLLVQLLPNHVVRISYALNGRHRTELPLSKVMASNVERALEILVVDALKL